MVVINKRKKIKILLDISIYGGPIIILILVDQLCTFN